MIDDLPDVIDFYDKSERQQFRADPKSALAAHGIETDNEVEYVVKTNSRNTRYFIIPRNSFEGPMIENLSAAGPNASTLFTVCVTLSSFGCQAKSCGCH